MDYTNIFIANDQPTTCPKCGNRTEIIVELNYTPYIVQHHQCLSDYCSHKFVVENDIENPELARKKDKNCGPGMN